MKTTFNLIRLYCTNKVKEHRLLEAHRRNQVKEHHLLEAHRRNNKWKNNPWIPGL